jgi:hypothetical protein
MLRAELEFLPQEPALGAAVPRNIIAGFVGRNCEELLIATR